jgi:GNAT superfamily N-acetyltransferase
VTSVLPLDIALAGPRHAAALVELFESNGFGCFCRFWHFQGNAREWLARCREAPEENRRASLAELAASAPEMLGLVATTPAGRVLGWLKLAPAVVLGKLYGQRLYKGLSCFEADRSGVFTVGCLLVREGFRRQGIARALLRGAVEQAPALGARVLEALPRSDVDAADAALMLGPTRLFLEAGFAIVHDFHPYPVLRLNLEELESGAS